MQNKINDDLAKERECIIDASVVRIMKGRRIIKYNDLLNDIVKYINSFKPNLT